MKEFTHSLINNGKKKKSYNKYIKFYINKLVFDNLQFRLNVAPPAFQYDIEIFYSLLNDLSNIPYYKDYEESNGFVPLASSYLKQRYGNQYNLYTRYLSNHSIVANSLYNTNACKYYKLNELNDTVLNLLNNEYYNSSYCFQFNHIISVITLDTTGLHRKQKSLNKLDVVCIKISTKSYVGKWIIQEHNRKLDQINHSAEHIRKMNQYFRATIKIDFDGAVEYTQALYIRDELEAQGDNDKLDSAQRKRSHRIGSIMALNEGDKLLRFHRNNTNKRLDTNLTNMAKVLRPFLVGYDNLSNLDLSNSQPVLFNILLKKKYSNTKNLILKKEMQEYLDITISGNWYEFLVKLFELEKKYLDKEKARDKAKDLWMEIAYSKNTTRKYKKNKKIFAGKFPEIYRIIEHFKKNDHAKFAIALQKIESEIFIDEICKELVEQDIIPYTLHDCFLVPKDKEQQTYDIMTSVLSGHLGATPVISVNDIKCYPEKNKP